MSAINDDSPRVLLCVLDGVGEAQSGPGNAVTSASTPVLDSLKRRQPWITLAASGEAVGLPPGQIGNSEVGHVAIGAGRIVEQDLSRIDDEIESGALFARPALAKVGHYLGAHPHAKLHLLGVLSEGGVHGHWRHISALAGYFLHQGARVYLHGFTDGRDALPGESLKSLRRLQQQQPQLEIVSLVGRFYAMDRDQNWQRTQTAADLILQGAGSAFAQNAADQALAEAYQRGYNDEYLPAMVCHTHTGRYKGIAAGDVILHTCFRADRARQLTKVLLASQAPVFCLTPYQSDSKAEAILPQRAIGETLGEVISRHQREQTRIAETEKYAHVTYFFNGGVETPFAGEHRVLVPSHKCASYAERPQMSAQAITEQTVKALDDSQQSLIVVNFANGDMVGHTGDFQAAVVALETLDSCLATLLSAAERNRVTILITADHGNAEQMIDPQTQAPHTAHTLNPVPLILTGCQRSFRQNLLLPEPQSQRPSLIDLAPTVLDLLAIKPPAVMTGRSLLHQP